MFIKNAPNAAMVLTLQSTALAHFSAKNAPKDKGKSTIPGVKIAKTQNVRIAITILTIAMNANMAALIFLAFVYDHI